MFTRGSEWHIWDLHLHTPDSYDYQDKSITDEQIVEKLKESNVSAAVITDHNLINFDRIKNLNDISKGDILFLRGIELTTNLGGSKSVHVIAIFPTNIENHVITKDFLTPLGLYPEEIKALNDEEMSSKYVDFNNFIKCAKDCKAITTIHAGHKSNSIENICNEFASKKRQKRDILEQIDILETGKISDLEDYNKIVFPSTKLCLPIVITSDNHNIKTYQTPPTWIKSDISYEGLKQVLFEPILRVKVQTINPILSLAGTRIESLKIENTKMFSSEEINFNTGLISIIGEKGSGKTALLDMIALSYGKSDSENNFINRGYKLLKDSKIYKKDYSNTEIEEFNIDYNKLQPNLLYVSPSLLNQYCENNEKMQKYIKDMIEDGEIKDIESELCDGQTYINTYILNMRSIYQEIQDEQIINEKLIEIEKQIKRHKKTKPKIKQVSETELAVLESLNEEFSKNNKLLNSLTKKHVDLVHLQNTLQQKLDEAMRDFSNFIVEEYQNIDFDELNLKIDYNINPTFMNKLQETANITNIQKEELQEKLNNSKVQIDKIEKEIYDSKETYALYNKWKDELTNFEKDQSDLINRKDAITELKQSFNQMFNNIKNKFISNILLKKRLFQKYVNLQSKLEATVGNIGKSKIKFLPQIRFNQELLLNDIISSINMKGVLETELNKNIENKYIKTMKSLLEDAKTEELDQLINLFSSQDGSINITTKDLSKQSAFKNKKDIFSLYELCFGDYIIVDYNIMFNGMDISQLSAGQKGIVLIKLLLRLNDENYPLLIDQPEDNLDNKSIFDELVQEFKSIKQKRQLIIATHNPNLVVNTDSEQVIIADYNNKRTDGYIRYISGSLEDPSIKDQVCNILEGGLEAFEKRMKKYNSEFSE